MRSSRRCPRCECLSPLRSATGLHCATPERGGLAYPPSVRGFDARDAPGCSRARLPRRLPLRRYFAGADARPCATGRAGRAERAVACVRSRGAPAAGWLQPLQRSPPAGCCRQAHRSALVWPATTAAKGASGALIPVGPRPIKHVRLGPTRPATRLLPLLAQGLRGIARTACHFISLRVTGYHYCVSLPAPAAYTARREPSTKGHRAWPP